PSLAGIEPRGLASQFLRLQLLSTVIPVVDFFGEPIPHGCHSFANQFLLAAPNLLEVNRDELRNRVLENSAFKITAQPVSLQNRTKQRPFLIARWPTVQIRRVSCCARRAVFIDLNELHLARHYSTIAHTVGPCVLNSMLQVKKCSRTEVCRIGR